MGRIVVIVLIKPFCNWKAYKFYWEILLKTHTYG